MKRPLDGTAAGFGRRRMSLTIFLVGLCSLLFPNEVVSNADAPPPHLYTPSAPSQRFDPIAGSLTSTAHAPGVERSDNPSLSVQLAASREVYTLEQRATFTVQIDGLRSNQLVEAFFPTLETEVTADMQRGETSGSFQYVTPPLGLTGEQVFTVRVLSQLGRVAAEGAETVSVVAPTLTFSAPSPGDYFSFRGGGAVEVSLEYSDSEGDLRQSTLSVLLDGTDVTTRFLRESHQAYATIPGVSAGSHLLTARLEDQGGLVGWAELSFTHIVDKTPPVIVVGALTSPTSRAGQMLDGHLEDAYPATLTLNGVTVPLGGDKTFLTPITLLEGVNHLTLVATDRAGWQTTHALSLVGDFTPPRLSLAVPVTEAVVSGASVQVSGTVEDASEISVLTLEGQSLGLSGSTFNQVLSLEAAGPQVLDLLARDAAGNVTRLQRVIHVDSQPPEIVIRRPAQGTAVSGSSNIEATFRDYYSPIDVGSVRVTLDGVDITGSLSVSQSGVSGSLAGRVAPESEGTLSVSVADTLGNVGSQTSLFYVSGRIDPPEESEDAGTVWGTVVDSSVADLTTAGLAGAEITLRYGDVDANGDGVPDAVAGRTVSGPNGAFSFPVGVTGLYHLTVEKAGYTYGQRKVEIVREQAVPTGRIALTPLKSAQLEDRNGSPVTAIDAAGGIASSEGTQSDGTPWRITVAIPEGALPDTDVLEDVTLTWFEHARYLPSGGLPEGTAETYAFNLHGTSRQQFDVPITVRFTNTRRFPAYFPIDSDGDGLCDDLDLDGSCDLYDTASPMQIPTGYWNPDTLEWEHVGQAKPVDADADGIPDGDRVNGVIIPDEFEFQTMHFSTFDCNDPITIYDLVVTANAYVSHETRCCSSEGEVHLGSGTPGHNPLPPGTNGQSQGNGFAGAPILMKKVIEVSVSGSAAYPETLSLSGAGTVTLRIGGHEVQQSLPVSLNGSVLVSEPVRFEVSHDENGGSYPFDVRVKVPYIAEYWWADCFGCEPLRPTGVEAPFEAESATRGLLDFPGLSFSDPAIPPAGTRQSSDSSHALGIGWSLVGQQRLVRSEDGYVTIYEKDQVDSFYSAYLSRLPSAAESDETGGEPTEEPDPLVLISEQNQNTLRMLVHSDVLELKDFDIEVGRRPEGLVATPDSRILYVANRDSKNLSVIDIASQGPSDLNEDGIIDQNDRIPLVGTPKSPEGLAMLADGSLLFVTSTYTGSSGAVNVIDVATQSRIAVIPVSRDPTLARATSDGKIVYVHCDTSQSIDVIDVASLSRIKSINVGYATDLQLTADERFLYVARNGTSLAVIDTTLHAVVSTLQAQYAYWLAGSPDSPFLFVAGGPSGMVRKVDGSTHQEVASLQLDSTSISASAIEVTPDGRYIYVLRVGEGEFGPSRVSILDGQTFQRVDRNADGQLSTADDISLDNTSGGLYASPDSTHVYVTVGTNDGGAPEGVAAIATSSQSLVARYAAAYRSLTITPDGTYLYAASGDDWTETGNGWVSAISHAARETFHSEYLLSSGLVGISPNEQFAASIHSFRNAALFDMNLLERVDANGDGRRDADDDVNLSGVANQMWLSPNGVFAHVTTSSPASLDILDLELGIKAASVPLASTPTWVGGSPDSETVYVLRSDGVLTVVDVFTQAIESLISMGGPVSVGAVAHSPDGRFLYVGLGSPANSIQVADLSLGSVVGSIPLGGPPSRLAFTEDGVYAYVSLIYQYDKVLAIDAQNHTRIDLNNDGKVDALDSIAVGGYAFGLVSTPDSRYVYVSVEGSDDYGETYHISAIDVSEQRSVAEIPLGAFAFALTATSDSRFVYCATEDPAAITVLSVEEQAIVAGMRVGSDVFAMAVGRATSIPPIVALRTLDRDDRSSLKYDPVTGQFSRHYPDGTVVSFNSDGTHSRTEDRLGNRLLYAYNQDGSVASSTRISAGSEASMVWQFNYEGGHLASLVDPAGRATSYTYDSLGRVISLTNASGDTTRYTYLPYDSSLLATVTSPTGEVKVYEYDADTKRVSAIIGPAEQYWDRQTKQVLELSTRMPIEPQEGQGTRAQQTQELDGLSAAVLEHLEPPVAAVSDALGNRHTTQLNSYGSPIAETNPLGHTTLMHRDSANRIRQITLPRGNATYYTYDTAGYVLSESQLEAPMDLSDVVFEQFPGIDTLPPTSITTRFTYEPRYHLLKTRTDPAGNTTTYTYDYENPQGFGCSDAADAPLASRCRGLLMQIEMPAVEVYDLQTHTLLTTAPTRRFSYNNMGLVETETDESGRVTRYGYDALGRVTQEIRDPGGLGITTKFADYTDAGLPQTIIDPNGSTTAYRYDANNNRILELDPLGRNTRIVFDDLNRPILKVEDCSSSTDALCVSSTGIDATTSIGYTSFGEIAHITRYDSVTRTTRRHEFVYDVGHNLALEIDPNGNRIYYEYDAARRLVKKVWGWTPENNAGLHSEQYAYDPNGNLVSITDPEGRITRQTFDGFDRLVTRTINYVPGASGTDVNLTTTLAYDSNGNLTSRTDPDGTVTVMRYDAGNHLVERIRDHREGQTGGLELTERYAYDAAGNRVLHTDVQGARTLTRLDAAGRQVEVCWDHTPDGVTGLNMCASSQYDLNGRLVRLTDDRGVVTRYEYDARGSLLRSTEDWTANGSGGVNRASQRSYDRLGRLVSTVGPGGLVKKTTYSDLGQALEDLTDPAGRLLAQRYTFDPNGNLLTITDPHGNTTSYRYDARHRRTAVAYPDGSTDSFTYGTDGRISGIRRADGTMLSYRYDGAGRLSGLSVDGVWVRTWQYDRTGRLVRAEDLDQGSVVEQSFNPVGDIVSSRQILGGQQQVVLYERDYAAGAIQITYPSGRKVTRTRDAVGRLDRVEEGVQVLLQNSYDPDTGAWTSTYGNGLRTTHELDGIGRATAVVSQVGAYRYIYGASDEVLSLEREHLNGDRFEAYRYDDLERVIGVKYRADGPDFASVTRSESAVTYTIDAMGNRLYLNSDKETVQYGLHDGYKLLSPMHRYQTAGEMELEYDPNGNLLSDGIWRYTYDAFNRLVSLETSETSITYTYDALDRRVRKRVDGQTTHYYYDDRQVLEERDGSGVLQRSIIFGEGLDRPLSMVNAATGERFYFHFDGLGSVSELTRNDGTLAEAYEYDIFGAPTAFSDGQRSQMLDIEDGVGNPYLFTGRRLDLETDQYYYRARYYHPVLGRFLSVDPLGFRDGLNRYTYAGNNPLAYVDPTGTTRVRGMWSESIGIKDDSLDVDIEDVELEFYELMSSSNPPIMSTVFKIRLDARVSASLGGRLRCLSCVDGGLLSQSESAEQFPLSVPVTVRIPFKGTETPAHLLSLKWKLVYWVLSLHHFLDDKMVAKIRGAVDPAIELLNESADILCEGRFDPFSLLRRVSQVQHELEEMDSGTGESNQSFLEWCRQTGQHCS